MICFVLVTLVLGELGARESCVPCGSFVMLDFNSTTLYGSNIGDQCDETLIDTDAADQGHLTGTNTVH